MGKNPVLSVMEEVVLRVFSDRITDMVSPDTSDRVLSIHKRLVEAVRKHQSNKAKLLMASDIATTGEMLAQMSLEARCLLTELAGSACASRVRATKVLNAVSQVLGDVEFNKSLPA